MRYLFFSFLWFISTVFANQDHLLIDDKPRVIIPGACLELVNHFHGADEKAALDLISHIAIELASKPDLSIPAATTIELVKITGPRLLEVVPHETLKTFFKVEVSLSTSLKEGVHAKITKVFVSTEAVRLYRETTAQSEPSLIANASTSPLPPSLVRAWIEILPRVYESLELEKEPKLSLFTPAPSAIKLNLNPWGWKEMALVWQKSWDDTSVLLLDTSYDLELAKQYWPFIAASRNKGALPVIAKRFGLAFYKKISDEITLLSQTSTITYMEDFIHDAEELEQRRPTAEELLKADIFGNVIIDHFGKWAAVLQMLQELQEMPSMNKQALKPLLIRAKNQYLRMRALLFAHDPTILRQTIK